MKNILKNIVALIILGVAIFVFRGSIEKGYFMLQDQYFPCSRTISYSVGTIDPSFGISKENFLSDIEEAENVWEASIDKKLFTYETEGGELTINLLYDNRQATTEQLKSLNNTLNSDRSFYNDLKNQIDILKADPNPDVNKINSLIGELNQAAVSFNSQAKEYNAAGGSLGNEFEEGLYSSDQSGKRIDIYQFENKDKLVRVLMHELGHALSLDHVNNPKAIMYQTNNGDNLTLTADDINELKAHCGIK